MATNMVEGEEDRPRCDGCGGVLEPWDAEPPVIYDCFHALHAACAHDDGRDDDACPRCHTPRWVHDDDDDDQAVDEAAAASPPDNNNPDDEDEHEDSASATSDGMGMGMGNDDDCPRGGENGEPRRPSRCDGESHASRLGCCACSSRVAELESRLEQKIAALTETTNVLESELERAQSRICRLEETHEKLEAEFIRVRNGKRAREIEDVEEEEEAAERRKERFKVHT